MPREPRSGRSDYRLFRPIPTRWMDNDPYAHVNNATYLSFFDTAVNAHLIEAGVLDIATSPVIGLVAETRCVYFAPVAFPDLIHAGIAVTRLGESSVRYAVGLFRNDDAAAAAQGHFVHVYVERATGRPVRVPEAVRAALAPLATGA